MRKIKPRRGDVYRRNSFTTGVELRQSARIYGFEYYRTSHCRNGHCPAIRRTVDGECVDCRRDRNRRWRRNHPEQAQERLASCMEEHGHKATR